MLCDALRSVGLLWVRGVDGLYCLLKLWVYGGVIFVNVADGILCF